MQSYALSMESPAAIWRSVPCVGQNYETVPGQAVEEPPFSAVKRFAQTLEVLFQRAPSDHACLVGWKDNLAGQEERGYRGVTKHKRTRRFEAHIWHDKKQVYLGGFVNDVDAARSHDIMSLWCKGWHVASLNYAAEVYSMLKPFAPLLSVADVRSCLRSCSKRQVAKDKASAPAEFGSSRKKIKARSVRARLTSPKRYSSNSHRSSQECERVCAREAWSPCSFEAEWPASRVESPAVEAHYRTNFDWPGTSCDALHQTPVLRLENTAPNAAWQDANSSRQVPAVQLWLEHDSPVASVNHTPSPPTPASAPPLPRGLSPPVGQLVSPGAMLHGCYAEPVPVAYFAQTPLSQTPVYPRGFCGDARALSSLAANLQQGTTPTPELQPRPSADPYAPAPQPAFAPLRPTVPWYPLETQTCPPYAPLPLYDFGAAAGHVAPPATPPLPVDYVFSTPPMAAPLAPQPVAPIELTLPLACQLPGAPASSQRQDWLQTVASTGPPQPALWKDEASLDAIFPGGELFRDLEAFWDPEDLLALQF